MRINWRSIKVIVDYYEKRYRRAIKARNIGIRLTICGLGVGIIGSLTQAHSEKASNALKVLYYGGAVFTNIGIIIEQ